MNVQDRIAAKRAAKGSSSSQPDESVKVAAQPRVARSERFKSAGFVDEGDVQDREPVNDGNDGDSAPAQCSKPPAPSPESSRAERFARARLNQALSQPPRKHQSPQTGSDEERERREDVKTPIKDWEDANRPAGSAYSPEEWVAAELASPGMTVFEVLKSSERALVSKAPDAMDVLLRRSLIVHEGAECTWRSHASAKMEHHGDFGVHRYLIIRSRAEREKAPWADETKFVIRDSGYEDNRPAQNAGHEKRPNSRMERFRG